jgi:predicted methyltransferase
VIALTVLFAVGGFVQVSAQPAVDPGINAPYQNPDVEYWRGVFETERREIYHHRYQILDALALEPGMVVADIGAGTGFFSLMFADAVGPNGHVHAVDISPTFVSAIMERAAADGFGNLTGVVNEPRDVRLAPSSIDLAFISDAYHHFEYPHETLRSIRDALRPGGALVVVDFRRIPGVSSGWVMSHVRAGADIVLMEVASAGFELVERRDFMPTQYYLRFRKADE